MPADRAAQRPGECHDDQSSFASARLRQLCSARRPRCSAAPAAEPGGTWLTEGGKATVRVGALRRRALRHHHRAQGAQRSGDRQPAHRQEQSGRQRPQQAAHRPADRARHEAERHRQQMERAGLQCRGRQDLFGQPHPGERQHDQARGLRARRPDLQGDRPGRAPTLAGAAEYALECATPVSARPTCVHSARALAEQHGAHGRVLHVDLRGLLDPHMHAAIDRRTRQHALEPALEIRKFARCPDPGAPNSAPSRRRPCRRSNICRRGNRGPRAAGSSRRRAGCISLVKRSIA